MGVRYSLIVPVYKNEMNISDLLTAVDRLAGQVGDMEAVFVVDGSPDHSWDLLRDALPGQSFPSRLVLLSRNFGSFAAIRTGLEQARGDYMAVMAADLQEPPELVPEFFRRLESGDCDVVMGQRERRGDPFLTNLLSRSYWKMFRRFVIPDLPPGGVDIFGCTRRVAESILMLNEVNTSLVAQLFWVGYRREFVPYERRAREKGKSAWTLTKKLKYFLDSVFSFSDLPLLLILWLGAIGVAMSLLIGFITLCARLLGFITVPGYTALLLVVLLTFSMVILSQGIMGCYLWRCFENTKRRPLTLLQRTDDFEGGGRGDG